MKKQNKQKKRTFLMNFFLSDSTKNFTERDLIWLTRRHFNCQESFDYTVEYFPVN